MSRAAIVAGIAVLDAISLRRPLTDREMSRLRGMTGELRRHGGDRVVMCGLCSRRPEDPGVAGCTSSRCGLADRHLLGELAA